MFRVVVGVVEAHLLKMKLVKQKKASHIARILKLSGLLLIIAALRCSGQTLSNKNICEKITQIDVREFKLNFIKSDSLQLSKPYTKKNGAIVITAAGKALTFTDYYEQTELITRYTVVGDNLKRNWIWVEEQGLHARRYLLINTKTARIDTLIGPAKIFKDKVVSLEDGYTDSPRRVEIYKIKNDRLEPLEKFELGLCNRLCCLRTIYLKGRTVFLADDWNANHRAWKIEVF